MNATKTGSSELEIFHEYRRLKQIVHHLDTQRDGIARNFGISGASLYLLAAICSRPNSPYKELAAYSGLAPNTVSSLVSSLIRQNLVCVAKDANDKRITRVSLTLEGRKLIQDLRPLVKPYSSSVAGLGKTWRSEELEKDS